MADIFISYARSTEVEAKRLEEVLRASGQSVWRDDELPAHKTYADVIEERLKSAKAVVVLWSADAARSQWVRAEADAARELGTLAQTSVDGTIPPMPFNQIQCADLKDWGGSTDHEGWRKLYASVVELVGETKQPDSPKRTRQGTSVCVLPFANMSGDAEQEYFSDGISEDITTDLSKVSALEVIARNTAFQFKGHSVDVGDVARKLGVSHVLEGSVRKAGDRVRITAQLIDGSTGAHVWADRYDRDLTDIFAIQDELSKAIVEALKVKLLPQERKAIEDRGTTSADAYDLYLMARNYWVTGNHGDRTREQRVIRICKRAVDIDPDYARAWALLSIAQSNLRYGFGEAGDDGTAAADRALSLDPTIAEAYCVRARPLREAGRYDEALEHLQAGLRLDPKSWDLHKAAANLMYTQRRMEEAKFHFEQATRAIDTDYHAWGLLYGCYRALGNDEGASVAARRTLAEAEKVLAQDPSNGAAISFVVMGLGALGEVDRAKDWMQRALLIDPDNLNMRYNFACTLASDFGDKEGALEMVEPTITQIKGSLGNAEFDPDLDLIRDDPRYQKWIADAKKRIASARREAGDPEITPTPASSTPLRS
ncbi:MAG TPA: TIR domain-containing protein [Sphingomicrobium sp.]|nr:TIR domain-containing protein [Sphingomicrobium sp.]